MKIKNINSDKLASTLGKIKGRATAFALAVTLATPLALTGCGSKKDADTSLPEDSVVTTTTTTTATTKVESNEIVEEKDNTEKKDEEKEYALSTETWNEFAEKSWTSVNGKINNIDFEAFKAALMVLNIEYLDVNNAQILIDYYGVGIDPENELNKSYNVLSQIREYNTRGSEIIKTGDLLISPKDRAIINVLESYLREVKNPSTSKERISEIFDMITKYSLGDDRIAVVIGDEIVEVAQIDLSKGAVMISEIIMQSISVECKDIISESKRAKLDNSLRTKDVLAGIQEIMIRNNAIASVTNPQVSDKETNETVEKINYVLTYLTKEVEPMGVTSEEVKALFAVYNIDYFMDTKNSGNAFKEVFVGNKTLDINKLFYDAEAAVEKIEKYNLTAKEVYDYGHFGFSSKTNIISVKALVNTVHNLRSDDPTVVSAAIAQIKGYTQYSSQATVNYQEYDENGNLTPVMKLDKNALNKGGNQVVDWITYYALLNNKSIINNDELVSSVISLVDGTTYGFTPYNDIVLMLDGYCAENNVTVYDYTVGQYSIGEYPNDNK